VPRAQGQSFEAPADRRYDKDASDKNQRIVDGQESFKQKHQRQKDDE
jgi:hypothetical protein